MQLQRLDDELVHTATIISSTVTQVLLLIIYLYYKYHLNKDVHSLQVLTSQEKLLHKIAVAMGPTVAWAVSSAEFGTIMSSVFHFSFHLQCFGCCPSLVSQNICFVIYKATILISHLRNAFFTTSSSFCA